MMKPTNSNSQTNSIDSDVVGHSRSKSSHWRFPKPRISFWKTTSNKTPGGAKPIQVRGAQHPPLYQPSDKFPKKKRNSVAVTIQGAKRSDFDAQYKPSGKSKNSNGSLDPRSPTSRSPIPKDKKLSYDYALANAAIDAEISKKTQANGQSDKTPSSSKHVNGTYMNGSSNSKKEDSSPSTANGKSSQVKEKEKILEWEEIKTEEQRQRRRQHNKEVTLTKLMNDDSLNSEKFAACCWKGVPRKLRAETWRLLLGYSPKNKSRRNSTLERKRKRYNDLLELYYKDKETEHRSIPENQIVRQINLDLPRTSPSLKIFQIPNVEKMLKRALFIWSHHHTATGYVQGINDLITPFVYVFLDELLTEKYDMSMEDPKAYEKLVKLSKEELIHVEADSYWCLDEFLESFQLNYTDEQPGIQAMVKRFEDLVEACDQEHEFNPSQKKSSAKLTKHLQEQKLEFLQFSFRWMNCFLMREFTLLQIIRMWDTYFSEYHLDKDIVVEFHIFVCVALILTFKEEIMQLEFAEGMIFIQHLPTKSWEESELSVLMSSAHEKRCRWGSTRKS